MAERPWTVYMMTDPRTRVPAYVGCTVSPLRIRLSQHVHDHCTARPVRLWIEWLRRAGQAPQIEPLFVVDDERTALALEASTIRRFTDQGVELLNTAHGFRRAIPTLAHVRLWAMCGYDWDTFNARLDEREIGHGYRRSIWRGYCPTVSVANELEGVFGVQLVEWLLCAVNRLADAA